MNKKYLPYIVLIAAALLLWYVKKNQRGSFPRNTVLPIEVPVINAAPFARDATQLIYTKHARCRMNCRLIDESEVIEILQTGKLNHAKQETDERGTRYAFDGVTHDRQQVRIVFAPGKAGKINVVTVIDLNSDVECNCN